MSCRVQCVVVGLRVALAMNPLSTPRIDRTSSTWYVAFRCRPGLRLQSTTSVDNDEAFRVRCCLIVCFLQCKQVKARLQCRIYEGVDQVRRGPRIYRGCSLRRVPPLGRVSPRGKCRLCGRFSPKAVQGNQAGQAGLQRPGLAFLGECSPFFFIRLLSQLFPLCSPISHLCPCPHLSPYELS